MPSEAIAGIRERLALVTPPYKQVSVSATLARLPGPLGGAPLGAGWVWADQPLEPPCPAVPPFHSPAIAERNVSPGFLLTLVRY